MKWLSNQGYLLIVITAVAWSGNAIVGRGVVDIVPPVGLAFWRWVAAFPIFLIIAWPYLRNDLPLLVQYWKMVILLALLSISIYNTFIYQGLTTTTAINSFLINTSRPVIIVLLSFLIFRERITSLMSAGLVLALVGTGVIITQGDIYILQTLQFNIGDIWIFVATIAWALYTVVYPKRPNVHQASLLAVSVFVGLIIIAPLYVWETMTVGPVPLRAETLWGVAYLSVISSVVAYMTYNRAVEVLGANKAGLTSYLLPVFGSILAILILNEVFQLFHGIGFVLILAGVLVAARAKTGSARS